MGARLTLAMVLLICVPSIAAQDLAASVEVAYPLDTPQAMALPSAEDPGGGCEFRQGMVSQIPPASSFRFAESDTEQGCARVLYNVEPPAGASSVRVVYAASRDVESADSLPHPVFLQTLQILVAGEPAARADVFQPDDPSRETRPGELLAPVPGNRSFEVAFDFADTGQTASEPVQVDGAPQAMRADVMQPEARFPGVPIDARYSQSVHDGDVMTTAYRLDVPEDVRTLEVFLPVGTMVEFIDGPTGLVDRYATSPESILIDDPAPGPYRLVLSATVPAPLVPAPGIAASAILLPALALAGSGYATHRFRRDAHPSQARRLAMSISLLIVLIAVLAAATVVMALRGGDPLHRLPLPAGGPFWLAGLSAIGVLGIMLAIDSTQQARRAQHLHHEQEMASYIERLARSNRDLEEFAYVASHDLQAPLRRIQGFLQLLKRRHGRSLEPEAKEFVEQSVQNSTHLQALIRDLLAFARLDQRMGTRVDVVLHDIVRRAVDEHRDEIDACGMTVDVSVDDRAVGSPFLLQELVSNLISNAIRYRDKDREPSVGLASHRVDGDVVLDVRDNGHGIHPSAQAKVFEIFVRADTSTEGTGIGLAACRRITELHDGTLDLVESTAQGSHFRVKLPAAGSKRDTS